MGIVGVEPFLTASQIKSPTVCQASRLPTRGILAYLYEVGVTNVSL